MNILLIYPECPETFWSYTYALEFIDKKALMPPIGLLTVAAMLPPEWGKRLVDLNVRELTDEDLSWADSVFVSGMSIQRNAARQVIIRCKAAGKKVIAGGPLFTFEYALFDEVDHFVLNEAELTLPPFLADLQRGNPQRFYHTHEFADVRQTPAPLWELADLKQYATTGVQFSRGCPYNCEFCNVTAMLGRRPRIKTGAQLVAELEGLHRAGWKGPIFVVDDNLIGNIPAVRDDLLPALIEWQSKREPVSLTTQVSMNLADDLELARSMVQAGFDTIFVGIETPNPTALEECGKSQNRGRDLISDIRNLQNVGLEVQGGFILGFDGDTTSIFQTMVDFIQKSGVVTAMVGLLQSAPGTRLHARMRSEGRLLGNASGDNADGRTNIVPRMGLQTLLDGYRDVMERTFSPRPYYERVRTFLREFRPARGSRSIRVTQFRTFARCLYRIGVKGKERGEFWKLLAWTLLRHPSLLYDAMRLAIYGRHYRTIFETRILPQLAVVEPEVLHKEESACSDMRESLSHSTRA
jgi:radical SAM superfamily enzyme YgiQ (UPF0313 family)